MDNINFYIITIENKTSIIVTCSFFSYHFLLNEFVKSQQLTPQNVIDCYELLQSSTLVMPSTTDTQHHFYYPDLVLIECDRESGTQPVSLPNVHKIKWMGMAHRGIKRLSCFCINDCSQNIAYDSFTYPGNWRIILNYSECNI